MQNKIRCSNERKFYERGRRCRRIYEMRKWYIRQKKTYEMQKKVYQMQTNIIVAIKDMRYKKYMRCKTDMWDAGQYMSCKKVYMRCKKNMRCRKNI